MSLDLAELAALRSTVFESLPDLAVVLNPTWASDGQGGGTAGWAVQAGGTYACRVGPPTGAERIIASKLTSLQVWAVTLPWDAVVSLRDRLVTGSHRLDVQSVSEGRSWQTGQRLVCSEAK